MSYRKPQIKQLLRMEVAEKSLAASLTFAFFSILIFFYYFQLEEYKYSIQVLSSLAFASSINRILVSRQYRKTPSPASWVRLQLSIWINMLCWASIFILGAIGLNSEGLHFVVLIAILTGFLSASIITLSYDLSLFLPFQLSMLLPLITSSWVRYSQGHKDYWVIALISILYLIYQIRQYHDFKKQLIQRFEAMIDLEALNKELRRSQEELINNTTHLVQSSKLSALSEMAAGLSHEVNNSLMVIMASSEQLERNLSKEFGVSDPVREKIQLTKEAIQKIQDVIHGLYCFSQEIDHGPRESIPLEEVIQRALNYCREMLKAHSIQLIIDEIPMVSIRCHPFKISMVLFNLLKNADDAVSGPKVEERWIRISFRQNFRDVEIIISNSGELIPPRIEEKLFQPFFTTKGVGRGMGLSLSMARGIIRDHGGDLIHLKNQGHTAFMLRLPLA